MMLLGRKEHDERDGYSASYVFPAALTRSPTQITPSFLPSIRGIVERYTSWRRSSMASIFNHQTCKKRHRSHQTYMRFFLGTGEKRVRFGLL